MTIVVIFLPFFIEFYSFYYLKMPKLSIETPWTYGGWDCIFKYEIRWYMSGDWTIIKINPYWYITLIHDNSLEHTFGDRYGNRFDDDEDDGDYNEDSKDYSKDYNLECDNSYGEKYRVKRIKLDETSFQKIKKIIDDNIETLATMWWLEPEPHHVMDWCYSQIFLWGDDISIQAEVSNLWQYNIDSEWSEQYIDSAFIIYGENGDDVPKNMTMLMNVFFRIRDILVENWIDERYFAY